MVSIQWVSLIHPDIASHLCKPMKKTDGHVLVPTLSDHYISASTNVYKFSVAWRIRKILMES